MHRRGIWCLALALLAGLVWSQAARANDPASTTITLKSIHCEGCAKRISKKLAAVPGVAVVQTDVPSATATVQPRAGSVLSPRALWEAVEKAGYQPTRLEGPSGTFTARPPS